ncbi:hypothetical protein NPIL_267511 [Nephila pilipes]|uniref:Uncharacterized protein n=1 Tax=Nephila pilipes TaxID=299642 RepID=A0A8X6MQ18_NEPPI|nr:hypothetical protein NPIL_267511 [Nephila pilipes]
MSAPEFVPYWEADPTSTFPRDIGYEREGVKREAMSTTAATEKEFLAVGQRVNQTVDNDLSSSPGKNGERCRFQLRDRRSPPKENLWSWVLVESGNGKRPLSENSPEAVQSLKGLSYSQSTQLWFAVDQ